MEVSFVSCSSTCSSASPTTVKRNRNCSFRARSGSTCCPASIKSAASEPSNALMAKAGTCSQFVRCNTRANSSQNCFSRTGFGATQLYVPDHSEVMTECIIISTTSSRCTHENHCVHLIVSLQSMTNSYFKMTRGCKSQNINTSKRNSPVMKRTAAYCT